MEQSVVEVAALYDDATNAWTDIAPLSKGRVGQTPTLLEDGRVLVSGRLGGFLERKDGEVTVAR